MMGLSAEPCAAGAAAITLNPGESAYLTPRSVQIQDVRISADLRLDRSGGRGYYAYTTRVQSDGSAYRIRLLTDAADSFRVHLVEGLVPREDNIRAGVERSLMLVTALAPHIGYDRAAMIAKAAHKSGRPCATPRLPAAS